MGGEREGGEGGKQLAQAGRQCHSNGRDNVFPIYRMCSLYSLVSSVIRMVEIMMMFSQRS